MLSLTESCMPTLTISTLQKGRIRVADDQLTTLVTPLLGFPALKRWLFYQTEDGPIHWMQSVDDPQTGFCLLAPFDAGLDPDIELGNEDVSDIGAMDASDIDVYTMMVFDRDLDQHRTNLRAPILVCRTTQLAKQVVLHDTRLPIRFVLPDLKPIGR
jgi:flagellar assembly factor FliW